MNYPSKTLEQIVTAIGTLPGIGRKTALRLALHLIGDKNNKAESIAHALSSIKTDIKYCNHCFVISDDHTCSICKSHTRANGTLCVVETIKDLMAIESTGSFHGKYHILGGLISPLDGIGAGDLNIEPLIQRINSENISEIILAISPTIDGETTAYYISKKLKETSVKITTIARGVSFGGELEYTDELTLGKSISGRLPYHMSTH